MMKPHELARAATLRSSLEPYGLADLEERGPFGKTLGAILLYRRLARDPVVQEANLERLAELLCLYAAGIFRGDGQQIAPYPPEAAPNPHREDVAD